MNSCMPDVSISNITIMDPISAIEKVQNKYFYPYLTCIYSDLVYRNSETEKGISRENFKSVF